MIKNEKQNCWLFSDPKLVTKWSHSDHRCGHSSSEVANPVTII
ncbi:MAG: hypothetical protein ACFFDV_02705 [Candidatus Thorarchaeota archaeon]